MSPLYDYRCKKCKKIFEEYHGINETLTECSECGGELFKTFENFNFGFINDFHDSYWDSGLGCVIKSRQQRNNIMKEKGLVEVGNERKYVMPEYGRKIQERSLEEKLKPIHEKAMHILNNAPMED